MSEWLVQLRKELQTKLKQSEGSTRSLATSLGVDYQRLYRFVGGEQKRLTYFEAKQLTAFVNFPNRKQVLLEVFPHEAQDLGDGEDEYTILGEDVWEFLTKSWLETAVFVFVTETPYVTREYISQTYGKLGLDILDELISLKAIEPSGFRSTVKVETCPDKYLSKFIQNYAFITNVMKNGHLARWFSRRLNKAGLARVYKIMSTASQELLETYMDPEYSGEHLFVAELQCGHMQLHNMEDKQ